MMTVAVVAVQHPTHVRVKQMNDKMLYGPMTFKEKKKCLNANSWQIHADLAHQNVRAKHGEPSSAS